MEKHTLNKFVEEFRRGLTVQNDNPTQAQRYFTRAFTYLTVGGYPSEKVSSAISLAIKDNESLVERMDWSFYMKDVPESEKDTRLQAFKRKLQLGH